MGFHTVVEDNLRILLKKATALGVYSTILYLSDTTKSPLT